MVGTVPLYGPLEAILGTTTATQPLFGHQSFPNQLPITISQSVDETDTCAWHHIHPLRPAWYFIHVTVTLCEGACRSSTLYYPVEVLTLYLIRDMV